MPYILMLLYIATIPLANYLIGHIGTICSNGACLIPVGFGLYAPSGVLMIGFALILRDLVQRTLGVSWGLACIGIGAIVSAFLSPPALVVSSVAAFLFGELCDFAVYTPLQRRGLFRAVIASVALSSIVDSVLFLYLAFGSVDFLAGQIVGKWESLMIALPIMMALRARIPVAAKAA